MSKRDCQKEVDIVNDLKEPIRVCGFYAHRILGGRYICDYHYAEEKKRLTESGFYEYRNTRKRIGRALKYMDMILNKNMTLDMIAKEEGVSRQRIQQVLSKVPEYTKYRKLAKEEKHPKKMITRICLNCQVPFQVYYAAYTKKHCNIRCAILATAKKNKKLFEEETAKGIKDCIGCKQTKSISEFYINKVVNPTYTWFRYYAECKVCHNKQSKAWMARNKEKVRAQQKIYSRVYYAKKKETDPDYYKRVAKKYYAEHRDKYLAHMRRAQKQRTIKERELRVQVTEFLLESNAIESVYGDMGFRDARRAWNFVKEEKTLDKRIISTIHYYLLRHLNSEIAGRFRNCNVYIGGKIAPNPHLASAMLDNWLLDHANAKTEEEIKKAHIEFEHIHPFEDGNGRVGRIIINWQRLKNKLPIAIIHTGEEQFEYYKWFK